MSLHPDLARLVSAHGQTVKDFYHDCIRHEFTDAELTAFALAVARNERTRCGNWLGECAPLDPCGGGATIKRLSDPPWAPEAP